MRAVVELNPRTKEEKDNARERWSTFFTHGEHIALMEVYNNFQANEKSAGWCNLSYLSRRELMNAEKVREQLVTVMENNRLASESRLVLPDPSDPQCINLSWKCLIKGFFNQVAFKTAKNTCSSVSKLIQGRLQCCICGKRHTWPNWVIFGEASENEKGTKSLCPTAIELEWLLELVQNTSISTIRHGLDLQKGNCCVSQA